MPRTTARRTAQPAPRERKNMRLDQALLDSAKQALGTESETEAVMLALQRVVGNARIAAGLRALGGTSIVDATRVDDAPAED